MSYHARNVRDGLPPYPAQKHTETCQKHPRKDGQSIQYNISQKNLTINIPSILLNNSSILYHITVLLQGLICISDECNFHIYLAHEEQKGLCRINKTMNRKTRCIIIWKKNGAMLFGEGQPLFYRTDGCPPFKPFLFFAHRSFHRERPRIKKWSKHYSAHVSQSVFCPVSARAHSVCSILSYYLYFEFLLLHFVLLSDNVTSFRVRGVAH